MYVDVLFDPFGGKWDDLALAAAEAEQLGFDGLWLWDHLAGSVHKSAHVLECWTILSAIAATVPRVSVGPMVLNVANRPAGTLAVMAATLQQVSGGRLLLGLGAGGGAATPYAAEQLALEREIPADPIRRSQVEDAVSTVRAVWSGAGKTDDADGFLRPDPVPPIIVGGFGPKMAELAGRVGDGINTPGGPNLGRLVDIARSAHETSDRNRDDFIVTASASPQRSAVRRMRAAGVDRAIVMAKPPYANAVRLLASEVLH